MKVGWRGRRGKESASARASHERKSPQDADRAHGELDADFLLIAVCCPQVRKKVPEPPTNSHSK